MPATARARATARTRRHQHRLRQRRQRRRCRPAHHLQPDRRPDQQEPRSRRRRRQRRAQTSSGNRRRASSTTARLHHRHTPGASTAPSAPQDDIAEFSFDNVTPDEGLSAPFNLWFVFFGQFFRPRPRPRPEGRQRHRVPIPLQLDDPSSSAATARRGTADDLPPMRFMVLTRAIDLAGARRHPGRQSSPPPHRRGRRRHPRAHQHHHALRRPEPDLHLAPLPPGVPARLCSSTPPAIPSRPASLITNRDPGPTACSATADDVEIGRHGHLGAWSRPRPATSLGIELGRLRRRQRAR